MPSGAKVAMEDKAELPVFTVGFFHYLTVQWVRSGAFPRKKTNKTKTRLCACKNIAEPSTSDNGASEAWTG